MLTKSDEELMKAYAGGDDGAYGELFRRYAARILRVLSRGLLRAEEGRDLLQQVFLQLHRHRHDYTFGRPFRPWLFTIAFNVKRQYLRSIRRHPEFALDDAMMESLIATDFGRGQVDYDARQALDFALAALPAETRRAIVLHWFGGMPLAEVAATLGKTEGATKVRVHRAYEAMRAALSREAEQTQSKPDPEE